MTKYSSTVRALRHCNDKLKFADCCPECQEARRKYSREHQREYRKTHPQKRYDRRGQAAHGGSKEERTIAASIDNVKHEW